MYSKVYLEITNICNKSCSFCHGTSRAPRMMSYDEFTCVAEKLMGLTNYIYFHLMGEPLLHPELPKMIKYASSLGFKCAITTNGTLLDERFEEILSSGVYKVNISLHSFEEKGENEFREYISQCIKFADAASKSSILTVLRLWNNGYDNGRNEDVLSLLKASLFGEWVFGSRGARIRDKLHLEYGERFDWPDMNAEDFGESVFCYGLKDQFGILADGTVVPCCLDSDGIINLGNAFTEQLPDMLFGKRAMEIRAGFQRRLAKEELCRRCGYARRFK